MKTRILLLSASALAIAWAGSAWAETKSDEDSQLLETVTVTALRRNENLMKSAISASVISGEQLQVKNVVQVADLQFVAPQITVDSFGQGINFNIRGIGKGEHNSATMTGVITYRDGTPTFPGYMTEEPYYDIASVEVLRGPQGTYVGQNATGGAVFVNTNNPDIHGGYSGYVMANVGNYAEVGGQGAINIPISDTFAARIAGFVDRKDPFYEITNNGQDYRANSVMQWGAVRLSLIWKPTDRFTALFKTDWDYLDNGPFAAGPYYNMCKNFTPEDGTGSYVFPGATNVGCKSTTPNPQYTGDPLKFTANGPNRFLDKFTRNTLKLEYAFPDGTVVRSIGSYQKGNTMYETDLDGTDKGTLVSSTRARNYLWYDSVGETIWTEEINVISPSDQRITWILGAFAQSDRYSFVKPWKLTADYPAGNNPYHDPLNGQPGSPADTTLFRMQGSNPKASWALFGQVSAKLFGGLEAQAGWRWSTANNKNNLDIWNLGTPIQSIQSTKSYSFDYKASLNWTINDNNFVYGFVATGYKPGGLNTPIAAGTTTIDPFRPERIQSYETGYKGTWFDGHVRAQFDGYYYEYKHFQVSIGYPNIPYFYLELNTEKPTIMYGFEGELEAVFGNFAASTGIGWLHSALGDFWTTDPRGKTVYYLGGANFATLTCNPNSGPVYPAGWTAGNQTCFNLKGHPQTYAPELTANFNIEYRFDIGDGDAITPRLSYSYTAPQWATLFDNEAFGDKLGVRNILGAQLEWKRGEYIITAYGTNLTDSHYIAAMESNLAWGGPPRQYGLRLTKVF
jgi:iron complex outermembrane receptor protein